MFFNRGSTAYDSSITSLIFEESVSYLLSTSYAYQGFPVPLQVVGIGVGVLEGVATL